MQDTYLRWPKVKSLTGLSRTTVWRLESCLDFPPRRQLGKKSVAWLQSEITAWMDSRAKVQRPQ